MNFRQSYLWSNSNADYKYYPIYIKFGQDIEEGHARGNVQQYLKKVVRKQRYDNSKLTIQIQDCNIQKYYNVNKYYMT